MAIHRTYTAARAEFAKLCDEATLNREIILINRRGHEDVALIAASELAGIAETAHLMRSPENARRLLRALRRAQRRSTKPQSIDELRQTVGFKT